MSGGRCDLVPGLVSISFRSWEVERIVREAAASGLQAIEWGGDVHCPHGKVQRAAEVARLTRDAGLSVAAYGSYYRVGRQTEADGPEWRAVLDSACTLGAPVVRVWAGNVGSDSPQADAAHWARVCADAARICASAAEVGVQVAFEYHGNVLTDGALAAERVFREAGDPRLLLNWQPQHHQTTAMGLDELRRFAHRLGNVHVFSWVGGWNDKRQLSVCEDRWRLYLELARRAPLPALPGKPPLRRHALLEFFPAETPDDLRRDAATLRSWLGR